MVRLIRQCGFTVVVTNEDDCQKREIGHTIGFVVRVFLETRDLVNYNHSRLGFLSENVSPSAENGRRNGEFVLFIDIPAVLAVDDDEISSGFYYVVDGETHLG